MTSLKQKRYQNPDLEIAIPRVFERLSGDIPILVFPIKAQRHEFGVVSITAWDGDSLISITEDMYYDYTRPFKNEEEWASLAASLVKEYDITDLEICHRIQSWMRTYWC